MATSPPDLFLSSLLFNPQIRMVQDNKDISFSIWHEINENPVGHLTLTPLSMFPPQKRTAQLIYQEPSCAQGRQSLRYGKMSVITENTLSFKSGVAVISAVRVEPWCNSLGASWSPGPRSPGV